MGMVTESLRVESVHPARAVEYLNYNFGGQRKYRPKWAEFLANEMREGRFISTAEIHIMYRNGEPVMVNGQHTCHAIVKYGQPVRVTVRKTITNEAGQIAMIYAHGHDNGLGRSEADRLSAYDVSGATGLPQESISQLASAVRHIRAGFQRDGRSGGSKTVVAPSIGEVYEAVLEWAPECKMFWALEVLPGEGRYRTLCLKRGSLSVIMVTLRYQPATARQLWQKVLAPDGLIHPDPRLMARRVLENSTGVSGAKPLPIGVLSRHLARCWNAYMKGDVMKQAPSADTSSQKGQPYAESVPIVIAGTPFTGRQPNPPWWPE